jgi:hypothetical protein
MGKAAEVEGSLTTCAAPVAFRGRPILVRMAAYPTTLPDVKWLIRRGSRQRVSGEFPPKRCK